MLREEVFGERCEKDLASRLERTLVGENITLKHKTCYGLVKRSSSLIFSFFLSPLSRIRYSFLSPLSRLTYYVFYY
jgi:hypothetical protein